MPGLPGNAWIRQIFQAGQVQAGNIVRRSMHDVQRFASPTMLERAVRARGFHMDLIGTQYVVVCNSEGSIRMVC